MSILSVDTISPIGSGTTVTLNATETKVNNFITVGTGASISSPSSNVLTLGTNNTEGLRLLSNGNLLLGTTVDGNQALNVYGASNAAIVIQNSNTGTGANNGLYIGNGNGTIGYVWNYENDSMRFATNNTERLRINSSGSIQITPEGSTSNPYMLIDTSGDSVRFNAQKASGNNEFRFLTQSSGTVTEKLRITSAGRLAILNNDENIDMDSSSNGQFQIDGNGYVGAITMNATGMFLYHNSNSRIIGIGVNETEVGRFTTGGYEQRFSNTSTYSTTTGSRKGIYVFNSGATTNCYASLELGANNSNGHFGSTILNSIATADTSYSNHFAIQLRHGGNYAERLRIQSDGHIVSGSNNTQNFGSSSNIWAGIFANYARFSACLLYTSPSPRD